MIDGSTTVTRPGDAPTAAELRIAVHRGDVSLVSRLVSDNPDLARAKFIARGSGGTALHFVTDWPRYFPNGPDMVRLLVDTGADPNATSTGPGKPETRLHYAASSDDIDVAAALIDRGADLELPLQSAPPSTNPIGYACCHVARLLAMRAARIEKVCHAAALGVLDALESLLVFGMDREEISKGFWPACGVGQRRAAERLVTARVPISTGPRLCRRYGAGCR
jgi:hypothetical protein